MGRDRDDSGQYDDHIPPADVLAIFNRLDDSAEPLTASDVVDELGIARRTAHNKLNRLVDRGQLETKKVGARGRVWWLPHGEQRPSDTPDDPAGGTEPEPSDGPDALDVVVNSTDIPGRAYETEKARQEIARETLEWVRERVRITPAEYKSDFVTDDVLERADYSQARYVWEELGRPTLQTAIDHGIVENSGKYEWVG